MQIKISVMITVPLLTLNELYLIDMKNNLTIESIYINAFIVLCICESLYKSYCKNSEKFSISSNNH